MQNVGISHLVHTLTKGKKKHIDGMFLLHFRIESIKKKIKVNEKFHHALPGNVFSVLV